MTVRREAAGRSPLALRLIHAAVFLAFAAGVVAAAVPEWQHAVFALGRPFHVGSPPRVLLVLGSVVAVAGAAALLGALVRGRSAPLAVSWLILGGAGAALMGAAGSSHPERPSELSANTALIVTGQRVQLTMVDRLQERGEVPVSPGPWQEALDRATQAQRLFFTRTFQRVPPQVIPVQTPEAVPQTLLPGALLLFVSPDGASFELRLVGLSEGLPQVLRDDTGGPVVLRGLYNPNLPASSGP
ncbi:hypothetical protein [Hyalangium minutum]|uniref:Uncharacterized protein n=1 Tax=Hyalangium minutum TaxID=394096 RepID=A0A085WFF0_9BACT|nr:hypothetical protein [Hyalangium minutum]KFE66413.1 hypothetical protein DB31_0886 [Hyalangium minutum]